MLILAILVLFVAFCLLLLRDGKYKFPPGPPRLPIIGSVLSVALADSKNPRKAFKKLQKRYGDIFRIQMGSINAVVINSHKEISRVSNSDELLSHFDENDIWPLEFTNGYPLGIFNALPEQWAETRAVTHKMLKKYGFNEKSKTGEIIVEEFSEFCNELKAGMENGEMKLQLTSTFSLIFLNIVWSMITGKKYDLDDPKSQRLSDAITYFMKSTTFSGNFWTMFPRLAKIFPSFSGFTTMKDKCRDWRAIVSETIQDHRSIYDKKIEPDNFLEEYINKVNETEQPINPLNNIYSEANLLGIMQDMSIGGMDTQQSVMKYFIKSMLKYPEIQRKLYDEVVKVVGYNRRVNVNDVPRLIYFQATLYELLRVEGAVPIAPRKLLKDWHFDDYYLPKGTQILINLDAANKDKEVWDNPTKFEPERFLSADGKIINTEKVLSFGIGKRRCIGEQLAKTSLLLTSTTLVQNFSFHVDPAEGVPSDGEVIGFTKDTVPFSVIIRSRN